MLIAPFIVPVPVPVELSSPLGPSGEAFIPFFADDEILYGDVEISAGGGDDDDNAAVNFTSAETGTESNVCTDSQSPPPLKLALGEERCSADVDITSGVGFRCGDVPRLGLLNSATHGIGVIMINMVFA